MKNNKINWLLILQGWTMLWVIIGHSPLIDPKEGPLYVLLLFKFAYSFHMPMFMLISGWLFYFTRLNRIGINDGSIKWNYFAIVKDKAKRLLLPGLVFSLLALLLKLLFPGEMVRQIGLSLSDFLHSYLYPNENPLRELWFIVTLFWMFLLTPLWQFFLKNKYTIFIALLAILLLHFWHPSTNLLCIRRLFSYSIWFYTGITLCKFQVVEKIFGKSPLTTLTVGICIYILGWVTHGFITTIGGIILSFGVSLLADFYMPKLFFTFRNYTYQIFLMGIFAQILVKIICRHVDMPYLIGYVLCIFMGLYVPVIFAKLVEKINWKPLSLSYGLK